MPPCRDNYDDSFRGSTSTEIGLQNQNAALRAENQRLKDRLDMLARLACAYCSQLEKEGKEIPKEARGWWKHHKKMDEVRKREEAMKAVEERARIEAEKKKQDALNKLTAEEKRLLGL